jgi:hypothetical protein
MMLIGIKQLEQRDNQAYYAVYDSEIVILYCKFTVRHKFHK